MNSLYNAAELFAQTKTIDNIINEYEKDYLQKQKPCFVLESTGSEAG